MPPYGGWNSSSHSYVFNDLAEFLRRLTAAIPTPIPMPRRRYHPGQGQERPERRRHFPGRNAGIELAPRHRGSFGTRGLGLADAPGRRPGSASLRVPLAWAASFASNNPMTQFQRAAHHFGDRLEPGHAVSGGGGRLFWTWSRFTGGLLCQLVCWSCSSA